MKAPGFITPSLPLSRRALPSRRAISRRPPAMVATAAETDAALSDRALQLLSYVRAHKSIFLPGTGFTATTLALFRKNDTARCMVPADELDCNASLLPGVAVARGMLENAEESFEAAKAAALGASPELGKDSEKVVSDIFWHDLKYFARVLSYGIACGSPNYIHANNLGMVKQLYGEISLATGTVLIGIASLKQSTLKYATNAEEEKIVNDCFTSLMDFMAAP